MCVSVNVSIHMLCVLCAYVSGAMQLLNYYIQVIGNCSEANYL
jgi:hypothetical protein